MQERPLVIKGVNDRQGDPEAQVIDKGIEHLVLDSPYYALGRMSIAARRHHSKILNFCVSIGAIVNDDAVKIGALDSGRRNVYKTVTPADFKLNYDHSGMIWGPFIWTTLTISLWQCTFCVMELM